MSVFVCCSMKVEVCRWHYMAPWVLHTEPITISDVSLFLLL